MIKVSVSGVDSVLQNIGSIPDRSENAIRLFAERVHHLAVEGAQKHSTTAAHSGALWRSLGSEPKAVKDGFIIRHDRRTAKHAPFVHWGTRPHPIAARNKKALRWAVGGGFAFAKKVQHKGYAGDPYLLQAAEQALREFNGIINRELKNGV